MKQDILEQIKEYVIEPNASITESEIYQNLEGDWVLKYRQDGENYRIMIEEF